MARAMTAALAPWRKRSAVHDPTKIVDLTIALGLRGNCLTDVTLLYTEPAVFGLVATDATVSRTIAGLAKGADTFLAAIAAARAVVRARAWKLAGEHAPAAGGQPGRPLIVDRDATLLIARSGARTMNGPGAGEPPPKRPQLPRGAWSRCVTEIGLSARTADDEPA
jgi:hypothetical protein